MSDKQFALYLWTKTCAIVQLVMDASGLPFREAAKQFYDSKTYERLERQDAELWQFSNLFLYRVFEHEQQTGLFELPEVVL